LARDTSRLAPPAKRCGPDVALAGDREERGVRGATSLVLIVLLAIIVIAAVVQLIQAGNL